MFKKRRWLFVLLLCLMLATILCCAQIGLLGVLPSEAGAHIQAKTTADYRPWDRQRIRRVSPLLGTISALDATDTIDNSAPPLMSTEIVMLITNTSVVVVGQNPTSTPTLTATTVPPTMTQAMTLTPSLSPTPPTLTATASSTPTITATASITADNTETPTASSTVRTATDTPTRRTPRFTSTVTPFGFVASSTPVPPTLANSPIPASATPVPPQVSTNTPVPSTAILTATNTPIPPTAIPTTIPSATNPNTPIPPTNTLIPTATSTLTPSRTFTPTSTSTPTNTPTITNTPVNYLPLPQQINNGIALTPTAGANTPFYTTTFGVAYTGGPVILSANADGTGNTWVDDIITITVTHPDSTVSTYTYNYDNPYSVVPLAPIDLSAYFQAGNNIVTITLSDSSFGGAVGCSSLWLGIPIGATNTPAAPFDLMVSNTVSNAAPQEGSTITYTVTATNIGASSATGIQITDLLPAGLTFIAAAPGPGSYNVSTGVWTFSNLAAGANTTLTLSARVNSGTAGTAINASAALTASTPADTNATNNTASVTINPVAPNPSTDLALQMTASASPIVEGGALIYTVTVINNGSVAATNILITDVIPAGLTFQSASGAGVYNSGGGQWTLASLGIGARASLGLSVTVNTGTAGQNIVNSAAITSVNQPDPNTANNTASVTKTITGNTLSVALNVDNLSPNVGQLVTYTVTLSSHSAAANNGINVTDLLPNTMTFSSAVPAQGTYNNGTGVWNVGTLASGAVTTLQIVASPKAGAAGTQVANTATITAASLADPTTTDNAKTVNIVVNTVSTVADLGVTMTVNNASPAEGAQINYTVTVTNNGPQLATGIQITHAQVAGITLVSGSYSQGSNYNVGTGVWTVGSLVNGGSATLNLIEIVNSGTGGTTITDSASVTASNQTDTNAGNNSASAPITVAGADLAVAMSASNPNPAQGSTFFYQITVTNNGPTATTNVQITDPLPTGLSFLGNTQTQGGYNTINGLWTVGNLAAGASATLNLTVSVNSGTLGGTIVNTASASYFALPDPNSGNNSASLSFNVLSIPNQRPSATPQPQFAPTFVP
ncbi:MAG: hypothetical protein ABI947_01325 [Chloroflexota bacterium]